MLHKTVFLVNLQVYCPASGAAGQVEIEKLAGQLRHLFYNASLPWHNGNLGRVIPIATFEDFYGEYEYLQAQFFKACGSEQRRGSATLTVIPFPKTSLTPSEYPDESLLKAPEILSAALQERFERRIRMLQEALQKKKRFYKSLLTELEKVVNMGIYLEKDIDQELMARLRGAQASILRYTAEEIRHSSSLRKDIITICGALLC
jgi:hypothetical protein